MQWDMLADVWRATAVLALGGLLLAALVFDAMQRAIPLKLMALMLLAGVLVNSVRLVADPGPQGPALLLGHPLGTANAAWGALLGLAACAPLWVAGEMRSNGIKCMAGIGSFAGAAHAMNIAVFALGVVAVWGLLRLISQYHARRSMAHATTALGQLLPGSAGTFDPAAQRTTRLSDGLTLASSVAAYTAWLFSTGQPLLRL